MTYRTPAERGARPEPLVDDAVLARLVESERAARRRAARAADEQKRREQAREAARLARLERRAEPAVRVDADAGGWGLSFRHRAVRGWTLGLSASGVGILLGVIPLLAQLPHGIGWIFVCSMVLPLVGLTASPLVPALLDLRPVHLYVTRQGRFVLYRSSVRRPLRVGLVSELELEVLRVGDHRRSCRIEHRGRTALECTGLLPRDVATLRRFGAMARVEVDA